MSSLPILDDNVNKSPHVVLLGAGASLASFNDGDANGIKLPLMNNLIDVVGLNDILDEAGISYNNMNFEVLYDELVSSGNNARLVKNIECAINNYFSAMVIPDKPTIYDYLILSLRDKDLIATYNWDPFLLQAYKRNEHIKGLPELVFLHGNVGLGVCNSCKRLGYLETPCMKCNKPRKHSQLLYPIKKKNYNMNPVIKNEWDVFKDYLNRSYLLTIFGYSAPVSDVEAKEIMLDVWKDNPIHKLAEIEIIDIKSRDELKNTWNDFINTHHYIIRSNFFDSRLCGYPRRSCDAFAAATLNCTPWYENNLPKFDNIGELHDWLKPLLDDENNYAKSGTPFQYGVL